MHAKYRSSQGIGLRGWRETITTAIGPYVSTKAISTNTVQCGDGPAWMCVPTEITTPASNMTVA